MVMGKNTINIKPKNKIKEGWESPFTSSRVCGGARRLVLPATAGLLLSKPPTPLVLFLRTDLVLKGQDSKYV